MVWILFRRTIRVAEARAVRKAVSVEACRMPMGWPVSEKTVMAPVGLILGLPVASSFSERGRESVMTILAVVSSCCMTSIECTVYSLGAYVPFTPTPAGLLEGMNSVVAPVAAELTDCR